MKRYKPSGLAALSCIFLFLLAPLSAYQVPSDFYPDSAEVRTRIMGDWLTGELDRVRLLKPAVYTDRYGTAFAVSQKRDPKSGFLTITISPEEKKGQEGDWIVWRRLSDGMVDHISVYPVGDGNIRVDIRPETSNPEKGRSLVDLVVYGAHAVRNVTAGSALINLCAQPFSEIVALTAKTVPWELLDPDPVSYGDIRAVSDTVRNELDTLVYLDDGAFNEKGAPVFIEDGSPQDTVKIWDALKKDQNPANVIGGVNCSGFGKWIVDGIIAPVAGEGTRIESLKSATSAPDNHFTEPYREDADLYFALDWTRNLASAVVTLDRKKTSRPTVSGVDVVASPFPDSCHYEVDVGYKVTEILPLLYWLALREPGNFYLGAVSTEKGVPVMRHYHHVVAFFPYFAQDGQFTVAVYESAREASIDEFRKEYPDSFVNLVRIRSPLSGYFEP